MKRGPLLNLTYAGRNWQILKHAHFGVSSLCYDLIFGEHFDRYSHEYTYICYLKDRERDKLIEVLISSSFINMSDRYFQILSTYA